MGHEQKLQSKTSNYNVLDMLFSNSSLQSINRTHKYQAFITHNYKLPWKIDAEMCVKGTQAIETTTYKWHM